MGWSLASVADSQVRPKPRSPERADGSGPDPTMAPGYLPAPLPPANGRSSRTFGVNQRAETAPAWRLLMTSEGARLNPVTMNLRPRHPQTRREAPDSTGR